MKFHLTLFCVLFIVSTNSSFCQTSPIDSIAGRLIQGVRTDRREKLFIHTDRLSYLPGETIWFKVFVLDSVTNKILPASKTLMVDLVNEADTVVTQLLLNIKKLQTNGNMDLPALLQPGNYWLRAYTMNILKNDSNKICVQPIYIRNAGATAEVHLAKDEATPSGYPAEENKPGKIKMTFFPEGGALIPGVGQTIAFRVTNETGKPLPVSGFITNNSGTELTQFKTVKPGLGMFSLFITKSQLTVHVKSGNDTALLFKLPSLDPFAYQLSVINQTETGAVAQVSLGDSLYKKNKQTYIVGVHRDSVCFASVGNDMYRVNMPLGKFPGGESTLLLFNEQQEIVSTRNIYIRKNNLAVDIKTDKPTYGAREKVKLDFKSTDIKNDPLISMIAVSVTGDRLNEISREYLHLNQMNLSRENFYLDSSENYSKEEMDLLMLTQPNEYFKKKWTGAAATVNFEEKDTVGSIHGKVLNKKNEPVWNQLITLLIKQRNIDIVTDTTDINGEFHFLLNDPRDSISFGLKTSNLKGVVQDYKTIVDDFHFPVVKTPVYLKHGLRIIELNSVAQPFPIDSIRIGKEWLKGVTVRAAKKKNLYYDEEKRVSSFSKVISYEKFRQGGTTAFGDALLQVPGLHLQFGDPLIVMDGIAVPMDSGDTTVLHVGNSVLNYLNSLSKNEVDFIEVLTGPEASIYGVRGGQGVIYIHTLNGPREGMDPPISAFKSYHVRGYHNSHLFAIPDYDNKKVYSSAPPDQRSTIYWNGDIITGKDGKASFEFFTADRAATYTVTVTGVTAEGSIIYKTISFNQTGKKAN